MQAWLFLSGFWTPDRVRSYLSKVPQVQEAEFSSFFHYEFFSDSRAILFYWTFSPKLDHNIHVLNHSMDIFIYGICYMILVETIICSVPLLM
jgi:hypothetical protein